MKINLTIFFVILFGNVLAQVELQKISPLSPNAAAFTKYTDAPVGYFTGIPDISIPVYSIKTRELSLPLLLSYHAGGNKVEEIASWVGLGWSLGTLPTISRKVCGISDESPGGYHEKYDGMSWKKIGDSVGLLESGWWIYKLIDYITKEGIVDSEADIYYYNLPGKSGKFLWNQDLNQFITIPWSDIKISSTPQLTGFKIIDDDGVIYEFGTYETTQIFTSQPGSVNISTWVIDKMYNADKTDSILFNYTTGNSFSSTFNLNTKTLWGTCPNPESILSNTSMVTKMVSSIEFNEGYVNFNLQENSREDLSGGYALDNIGVFNNKDKMIKKLQFNYDYRLSGTGQCGTTESKRLFLKDVSARNSQNEDVQKYSFLYDSIISMPCRTSSAQDFWGFYNGANSNVDLNPTVVAAIFTGQFQYDGANRNVNPNYSQFGILKRIYHPTGGYSDFEYENNTAHNNNLPTDFQLESAYLSGEEPITSNTYIDTFSVANLKDYYLNNNNGGAILKIVIADLGCDLSGGGNSCATLTLRGIDPANSHINTTITYNVDGFHVPNGNYEMKAVFNQNPPQYGSFMYFISWRSLKVQPLNKYIGGVRIKKINSFDQFGNQLIKKYRYSNRFESDTSSGDLFGTPYFFAIDNSWTIDDIQCVKLTIGPNMPTITHSGNYAGYKSVFEEIDSAGTMGLTEYNFTHQPDYYMTYSPYAPPQSYEVFRGQPLKTITYKKENGNLIPIKRTSYEYQYKEFDSLASYGYRVRLMKPSYISQNYHPPLFEDQIYSLTPQWTGISRQTTRTYDQKDTTRFVETVMSYNYNDQNQLASTKLLNSHGDSVKTIYHYPYDLTFSGDAEAARQLLMDQNRIATPLKVENFNNTALSRQTLIWYKKFGNTVKPEEILLKIADGNLEPKIKFLKYNTSGNLISQQKTDDFLISYIWSYNNSFPVAECKNADSSSIAYTSFEGNGKGNWTFSGAPTSGGGITGKMSYSLATGNITKSGLMSARKYIVSYWSKGNVTIINGTQSNILTGKTIKGWTYHELAITGTASLTLTGSTYIDELRLYPVDGQMITYTYEPLIGMTSQCDVNNKITYYEYDAFGRLALIRDENESILKKICYNYAGQPENCDCVSFDADWQNTSTSIRCKKNIDNKNTGEQEQEQKDMNPCSATYNQLQWVVIGTNLSACPLPVFCNTSNCNGVKKKCINNSCETGLKIYTDCYKENNGKFWTYVYHYEWSDGSWSQSFLEEGNRLPMLI